MNKDVLLVEDEFIQGQLLSASLQAKGLVVYLATTLTDAQRFFSEKKSSLDAIMLDGCIHSNLPNTQPLIKFFKESGFQKPIIAISSEPEFSLMLCNAGATHMKEKQPALAQFVLELLT